MSASIHASSVHSVRARVRVSSGGPSYPDALAAARAVLMPVTLPPAPSAGFPQVRYPGGSAGHSGTKGQKFAPEYSHGYVNRHISRKLTLPDRTSGPKLTLGIKRGQIS